MTKEEIENMQTGDIALAAHQLFEDGCVTLDWTVIQVERGIGDAALVACWLFEDGDVDLDWTVTQVERGVGSTALSACRLFECGHVGLIWTKSQIEKGVYADVIFAADSLLKDGHVDKQWADKVKVGVKL